MSSEVRQDDTTFGKHSKEGTSTLHKIHRHPLRNRTNTERSHSSSSSASSVFGAKRQSNAKLQSSIKEFFFESKRREGHEKKKREGNEEELVKLDKTDFLDDDNDESGPSSPTEKIEAPYTRLFIGQNEHCTRLLRRTHSGYGESPRRKRASEDGIDDSWRGDRKRSCAITLNDSSVDVEPDDDVFESLEEGHTRLIRGSSPASAVSGPVFPTHRVNFERTLSASVLERGEFSSLRDDTRLPAVPEIIYNLPTLSTAESQVASVAFGCITAHTLMMEWERLGEKNFTEKYVLIDCRYPYEYDGGHIKHAINLHDHTALEEMFFEGRKAEIIRKLSPIVDSDGDGSLTESGLASILSGGNSSSDDCIPLPSETPSPPSPRPPIPSASGRIPIFYCEYSQKRGPRMAHELRSIDRRRNMDRYPSVDYEVMYLLEKGYRQFYREFGESKKELFSQHCNYVEMEKEPNQLGRFKAHRKRGRKRSVRQDSSATTPGVTGKERRRASIVARQKIKESSVRRHPNPISRLQFDSEDE